MNNESEIILAKAAVKAASRLSVLALQDLSNNGTETPIIQLKSVQWMSIGKTMNLVFALMVLTSINNLLKPDIEDHYILVFILRINLN